MKILIYRNDESEDVASEFPEVRNAIDFMKDRASFEWKQWSEYIIKPKDDSQ